MNPTLKYKVIRGRLINSTITQRQLLHPEHKLLGSHNNMIWADTFFRKSLDSDPNPYPRIRQSSIIYISSKKWFMQLL